jgi:hypothetical protein
MTTNRDLDIKDGLRQCRERLADPRLSAAKKAIVREQMAIIQARVSRS